MHICSIRVHATTHVVCCIGRKRSVKIARDDNSDESVRIIRDTRVHVKSCAPDIASNINRKRGDMLDDTFMSEHVLLARRGCYCCCCGCMYEPMLDVVTTQRYSIKSNLRKCAQAHEVETRAVAVAAAKRCRVESVAHVAL